MTYKGFMIRLNKQNGFTIVELLVVIVVIGILAAITIVAYTGISNRAVVSSLQSDLTNGANSLKIFQVDNSNYPTTIDCTIPDSSTNRCIKASNGNTFSYAVSNTTNPQIFCITATKNSNYYSVSSNGTVAPVAYCPVLYLDAGNSLSYPGTGTIWTDLSGANNNGSLVNSVVYTASNGGALSFDGSSNYVNIPGNITLEPKSITVSAWIKMDTSAPTTRNIFLTKWNGYSCEIEDTTRRPYFRLAGVGDVYSTDTLILGNWYYFVGTFDKGVGSKIYLNGVLKGTLSSSSDISYSTNSVLNIGRYAGGIYFNGLISDVRIYSRSLDIIEIQQSFNSSRGRYGI